MPADGIDGVVVCWGGPEKESDKASIDRSDGNEECGTADFAAIVLE
jgi:hypothetical protein